MAIRKNELMEWIQAIIVAFILSLLIKTFLFEVILVDGYSMYPTINEKDRIIITKLHRRSSIAKRGDIVVFKNPDDTKQNYVKRVIALEGDKVQIKDGVLYINDEPLEEDYINEPPIIDYEAGVVPEDTIFVLGDNRNRSRDSRDPRIGFIPKKNIVGKARLRIWPLKNFTVFK